MVHEAEEEKWAHGQTTATLAVVRLLRKLRSSLVSSYGAYPKGSNAAPLQASQLKALSGLE